MHLRHIAATLALSAAFTAGFAQSGVPPATGNQEGASPDTSGAQTQQTAKHHKHKHAKTTQNDGTTDPNGTTSPNSNGTTPPATPPQQ